MNVLAFDTSSDVLSIAIESDKKYYNLTYTIGRNFSEQLVNQLKSSLESVNLSFKDLDLIVCSKGPGSFTGLRVGMAAAKGIAVASSKPFISLSSMEIYQYPLSETNQVILSVLDGKKERYYNALFINGKRLSEDSDLTIGQIVDFLVNYKEVVVTGYDAQQAFKKLCDEVTSRNLNIKLLLDPTHMGSYGQSMIELGKNLFLEQGGDPLGVGPTYVRKSDAELSLEKANNN
ncbi:MAG: tRNA (adenosine(37)-N6)-threonylcarbamoyltransferase complex dimerization subunit type 1 TsaB [Sphaerochaetaceae bacterium]|jgi:tRNA threonylcarbamoyladenosine biosynthesis protein TsaB